MSPCRLSAEQRLSADEIVVRDGFDCATTTVRKWLARDGLTGADVDNVIITDWRNAAVGR
jgi:hypothetical protein